MYRHCLYSFFMAVLAFALLLIPTSPVFSQDAADEGISDQKMIDDIGASVQQVPLTEDMVNRLIASYPEMRAAGSKFEATQLPDQLPSSSGENSDLDALSPEKRTALEAVAVKHGFKNLDEWTQVANSVVMSYAYAMQGKRPGSLDEALKRNIEHVQGDPDMTADEKQKAIEEFKAIGSKLAQLEPLQQNYDLVVRMKDKVTSILDPD